jgi:hypothetical protein
MEEKDVKDLLKTQMQAIAINNAIVEMKPKEACSLSVDVNEDREIALSISGDMHDLALALIACMHKEPAVHAILKAATAAYDQMLHDAKEKIEGLGIWDDL